MNRSIWPAEKRIHQSRVIKKPLATDPCLSPADIHHDPVRGCMSWVRYKGKRLSDYRFHEASYSRIAECNFFVSEPRPIAYLLVLVLPYHISRVTGKGGCGICRISILAALTQVQKTIMKPSLLARRPQTTLHSCWYSDLVLNLFVSSKHQTPLENPFAFLALI